MTARMIESICSWTKRYDLAKVLERGSYPVAFTAILTPKNYRYYWTLPRIALLLLILAIETVTNLLPTIATNYMQFQAVSFTRGDKKYFKYMYDTPPQAARIPSLNYSTDNPMKDYCEDMGLCTNGKYNTHVLALSPTMQVEKITYDYGVQKFVTDYVNVSTSFCLPSACPGTTAFFSTNTSNHHLIVEAPGLPSDIVTYLTETDDSDYGIETIFNASPMNIEYIDLNGDTVYEAIDTSPVISMLYRASHTDIVSVTHLSKVLFTNGQQTVLLVFKVGLHNLCAYPPVYYDSDKTHPIHLMANTFNNTDQLNNLTYTYDFVYYNTTQQLYISVAYTSYMTNDYFSVDISQVTGYYSQDTVLKGRLLFSVYVITDPSLPVSSEARYNNREYMTNYNATRSEYRGLWEDYVPMREPRFYDSMFDGFNEPPTYDLFMYAILDSSNYTLYGKEGYQDIVADISPIFVGIICAVLFVTLVVYAISRYSRDPLYFYTLYQAVGHIDTNGCIEDPSDVIPKMSIKDRTIYLGDQIVASEENMELLKHPETDDTNETIYL